jgi:hypothetical protein
MKWTMMLGGFALYAAIATLSARWLMLWISPTHSSYGDAVVWLLAAGAGFVCGLVGMCAGYYVHKKEYVGAIATSILLTFTLAIAVVTILS